MSRRPRKHIALREKLAAALAELLPVPLWEEMRRERASAKEVIELFEFDHVVLHSMGGSDLWWNLKATIRELHREKSRTDTKIAAKSKRLVRREAEHRQMMSFEAPVVQEAQADQNAMRRRLLDRPKRKIQSRGFSKQHRPMRWRRAP